MRRPLRRISAPGLAGLALFLFHIAFLPRLVWCHKADGGLAIETEIVSGECSCDVCLSFRRDISRLPNVRRPGIPAFEVSACTHERRPFESSLGGVTKKSPFSFFPSPLDIISFSSGFTEAVLHAAPLNLDALLDRPPPQSLAVLRC